MRNNCQARVSEDEAHRRAAGRRHYNAVRQFRARVGRQEVGSMGAILVVVITSIITISIGRRIPKHPKDGQHTHLHQLPYAVVVQPMEGREAVVYWMIANQLARRNLDPEHKSYLRGKRYNLEKRAHGGERASNSEHQNLEKTRDRLADEYGVTGSTISADADFAEAVDTLQQQVRQDLKKAVLKRRSREETTRTTKRQVTQAGQAVQEPQERAELEVEENTRRKDLTPLELSKELVRKASQVAPALSSTVDDRKPRGYRRAYAVPKEDVAHALGVGKGTLVRAEQHVTAAMTYPELAAPDIPQRDAAIQVDQLREVLTTISISIGR